jgi:hypothetical protein
MIGRFPGETSCLSVCWAVMDPIIAGDRGLGLTDLDGQLLQNHTSTHEHLTEYQLEA